ncbi:hypothetical protein ACQPYK_35680 [Streptosporangium sp. CA-135522]|uniref:hypothetical protein n=1 Tax=Streptosporangium sp. CA-135522 TaxID=3240072 RepID=UPI003D9349B8
MLPLIRLVPGPRGAQSWLCEKKCTAYRKGEREMKIPIIFPAGFDVAEKLSATVVSNVIAGAVAIGGYCVTGAAGTTWDSVSPAPAGITWV